MLNPIGMTVFFLLLVVVLVFWMYKSSKDGKKDLLDELWKNEEISDDTYKKYMDKF